VTSAITRLAEIEKLSESERLQSQAEIDSLNRAFEKSERQRTRLAYDIIRLESQLETGRNRAPIVESVQIVGLPRVGQVLQGEYIVHDPDGDPLGKHMFRWLRDGFRIEGANSDTYKLLNVDKGTLISFTVTPVSQKGFAGKPVRTTSTRIMPPSGPF